jgi:hypothetical protein
VVSHNAILEFLKRAHEGMVFAPTLIKVKFVYIKSWLLSFLASCRDSFHCDVDRCISNILVCDKVRDCQDGSDESDCTDDNVLSCGDLWEKGYHESGHYVIGMQNCLYFFIFLYILILFHNKNCCLLSRAVTKYAKLDRTIRLSFSRVRKANRREHKRNRRIELFANVDSH